MNVPLRHGVTDAKQLVRAVTIGIRWLGNKLEQRAQVELTVVFRPCGQFVERSIGRNGARFDDDLIEASLGSLPRKIIPEACDPGCCPLA